MGFFILAVFFISGCTSFGQDGVNTSLNNSTSGTASLGNSTSGSATTSPSANSSSEKSQYNFSVPANSKGQLIVYYFYSSVSCPNCPNTAIYVDGLKDEYSPFTEWRVFDVQKPDEGAVYWDLVECLNLTKCRCKVPFVYVNGTRLIGPYEINGSLEGILSNFSKTAVYDFSATHTTGGKLIVYFFHSTNCNSCKAIYPEVERIAKQYSNQTEWIDFNLILPDDKTRYFQFYEQFNITPERSGTPTILVNNTVLWGRYEINDSLEGIINSSIIQADATPS